VPAGLRLRNEPAVLPASTVTGQVRRGPRVRSIRCFIRHTACWLRVAGPP
jgi:hypothetical protein